MYDVEIRSISITEDEDELLHELLINQLDKCISIGEELTIKNLLDKLR